MAIPHFNLSSQSRRSGASAIAKAAYNAGVVLHELSGQRQEYNRKGGIRHRELMYSDSHEGQKMGREEFWQAVELSEKRKDACVSREIQAALPCELSYEANLALAQSFAAKVIQRYGLAAADLSIHYPSKYARKPNASGHENPHFHLLFPDRDKDGKKLRVFCHNPEELKNLRKEWEIHVNEHLASAGLKCRISLASNKKQIADLDADIRQLQAVEADIKRELDQIAKEETQTMTDAQLQYLALLARERADAQTRATLEAMDKAASIDFLRRNEAILQTLYESKYTDADAYAQLKYNAARYHLRRIAADEARRRREDEETRRNRRQYAAFHAYAKQHATAGQDARRVAAIMMYRAGAKASDIAARMVDAMLDENPADMSASEYICAQLGDQIGDALDAVITEALRDRGRWEKLDKEIAKIEDAYADMSLHAPQEYREGMEARKQEAIAAARALAAWEERQERAAQREAQKKEEKQQDQPPTPTAADARIFSRHAAQAQKTAPSPEKTNEMIALRLRACGHSADDAMRIMCAGMQPDAAMAAVASMYHTPHGAEMMRIARDCASQWKREEQGQDTIRRNGGAAGQAQTARPAAAPAAPRM